MQLYLKCAIIIIIFESFSLFLPRNTQDARSTGHFSGDEEEEEEEQDSKFFLAGNSNIQMSDYPLADWILLSKTHKTGSCLVRPARLDLA